MKSLNSKTLFPLILFLTFVIMLWYSDWIINYFVSNNKDLEVTQAEFKKIADLANSIDQIKIDVSILDGAFMQSLFNLPELPLDLDSPLVFGKANPFSGAFISTATKTIIVGGIISSDGAATGAPLIVNSPR